VEFFSRVGGNVPSHEEVLKIVKDQARQILSETRPEEERMANV
jgi:hypothetical protein